MCLIIQRRKRLLPRKLTTRKMCPKKSPSWLSWTRRKKKRTTTKVQSTSGRVLRSTTVSASAVASLEKCTICLQRLVELHRFHPEEEGVGLEQLFKDQAVNIDLGEEQESLQYKLTDFAVYDKVNEGERHLVPIFAESLLSAMKEL